MISETFAGHSSGAVHKLYIHADKEGLQRAADLLPTTSTVSSGLIPAVQSSSSKTLFAGAPSAKDFKFWQIAPQNKPWRLLWWPDIQMRRCCSC